MLALPSAKGTLSLRGDRNHPGRAAAAGDWAGTRTRRRWCMPAAACSGCWPKTTIPRYLYELAGKHKLDEEEVKRGRLALREAAAAALAQAGYEGDPRLRGAARRIVTRMA